MNIINLLNNGLYSSMRIAGSEFWEIDELFNGNISYDCFCKECGRDSVFHKLKDTGPKTIGVTPQVIDFSDSIPYGKTVFRTLTLRCTRKEDHFVTFYFSVYKELTNYIDFIKIGQFPTVADLLSADTKKYRSVLDKTDNHELNKAIGLFSHGVGIGSFVYLRRIFEKLIEKAHQEAINDPQWDESLFLSARMHEKVALLKQHLPEFLVVNRVIYSILSKGVHELTEEECLKAFPIVRIGIELILDEELAKKDRDKKKREATQALASLHQELK
ncbi:hypothetical protein [Paenibacillus sp. O199]|uniref:hypothetical protein n=1 Tax=Paenibacillus sp. O199 TaxID=1643925 RepID=UPI0007BFB3B2|nr:hypothetical protein [Paenibacillus sp. O199]